MIRLPSPDGDRADDRADDKSAQQLASPTPNGCPGRADTPASKQRKPRIIRHEVSTDPAPARPARPVEPPVAACGPLDQAVHAAGDPTASTTTSAPVAQPDGGGFQEFDEPCPSRARRSACSARNTAFRRRNPALSRD